MKKIGSHGKRWLTPLFSIAIGILFNCGSIPGLENQENAQNISQTTNRTVQGDSAGKNGSVIRIRFEAEPGTLNPWLQYSIYTIFIAGYIYDSLLEQDPKTLQWRGRLAETWKEEIISTGPSGKKLKFTFVLKSNARFHNGSAVSADDVAFSLDAIRTPELKSPLSSYFNEVESYRVVDSRTIELLYARPYWMAKKHVGELHILPRQVYDPQNLVRANPQGFVDGLKKISASQLPIGSGSYRVISWQRGSQLTLEKAVPASSASPSPKRIVIRFISDHVAALQALKNNEIDFIPRLDAMLFDAEQKNPEFKAQFKSQAYYTEYFDFIAWNLQKPFFKDKLVRQALAYGALDRKQFLDTILAGRGEIVTGSQYFYGPAYNHDVLPQPYDPDKARALLAQAGWIDRNGDGTRDKEGVEFRFKLALRAGNTLARQRAAVMQQFLSQLKIQMEIQEMELGFFAQAIAKREFDACSLGWTVENESDPYQLWHSSQVGESGSNLPGLALPAVDRLIEQSRVTLGDQERRKLFFELHTILHEEQPYLFLYCRPNLAVYSARLQGVNFYPVRPGYRVDEWQIKEQGVGNKQ